MCVCLCSPSITLLQDYGGRWKVLQYLARNFYTAELVSAALVPGSGSEPDLQVKVVVDGPTAIGGSVTMSAYSWKSGLTGSVEAKFDSVAAGTSLAYQQPLSTFLDAAHCPSASECVVLLSASDSGGTLLSRNFLFISPFTEVTTLQDPKLAVVSVKAAASTQAADGAMPVFDVTVSGAAVAPLVWLETKYAGVWSDNAFVMTEATLTLQFTAWESVTASELQESTIIESLYSFYN